ncbi:MAG: TraM recognition domain-containing protein [Bdellovibrionales bacterium]|nr:TraM recognition domain-containing protein [Bdellovibrionales bacterium]
MARDYQKENVQKELAKRQRNLIVGGTAVFFAAPFIAFILGGGISPTGLGFAGGLIPLLALASVSVVKSNADWIEKERNNESERRSGKPVLGLPPRRTAFQEALDEAKKRKKKMIHKYLVGFELNSGDPLWVSDDDLCTHAAVFAKTGVGKTLWLQSLMCQQMARGRASGFTFIDAKRDMGTLADIIMMALLTGRIEDVIVVDPFDPVCSYNFVFTTQRADVKARKVLRCGLPPTSDQSTTKHYDRLAADAVYRVVRAMESFGLAWSVRDIAVALSAFQLAYPRLRSLLHEKGSKQALVELGHLAGSYRTAKGSLDSARLTDNLRGIASELHSIANSEAGEMFCVPRADLSLTDAILRGKLIYYMLPRLEEAESAARMVKVFREDLEVSIGEITSNRNYTLEDPHMVIVDEGASTFGPTWANLFELARKGRFALMFGAQSVGGLMDTSMGLSEQFYERVMANVNLKVIMRIGDNRTAEDMSEWIGEIKTQKKTLATGLTSGVMGREITKTVQVNRMSSDSFRDGVTLSDNEEALVSPEELKHEMSAEKGLAWFDLGDGRLRKGRALWFNSDLPAQWEGREYLVRYESIEADEIGLSEWVDEHILSVEEAETERDARQLQMMKNQPYAPPSSAPAAPSQSSSDSSSSGNASPQQKPQSEAEKPAEEDEQGNFRFNLMRGFRGRPRARTFVGETPEPPTAAKSEPAQAENSTQAKPEPVSSSDNTDNASKTKEQKGNSGKNVGKDAAESASNGPQQNSQEPAGKQSGNAKSAKKGGLRFGSKGDVIVDADKQNA